MKKTSIYRKFGEHRTETRETDKAGDSKNKIGFLTTNN
jgi:hypothetical protein